jgi:golgi to ER traffic protein 4
MASNSTVQKQLDRIQKTLDTGAFYEAQQMYKTAYHRNKAKKLIPESHQVLLEGAMQQMLHGQVTCGSELALMLVEAFTEEDVPVTADAIQQVESLIESFPASSASSTSVETLSLDELDKVANAAIAWVQHQGVTDAVRQLHDAAGRHTYELYKWKQLGRACHHLVRGRDANAFAEILGDVSKLIPAHEVDYLVSRAVLQTLAAANSGTRSVQESHAHVLFEACRKLGLVGSHPMSNFTKFVLMALDAEKQELLSLVKQKYRPCWSKDASIEACLLKIEQLYFGSSQGGGGGMGGLLQELMKSFAEEEDG